MIAKVLDTLTGRAVDKALEKNKTALSLKDQVAEARAKADAEALAKEAEERNAARVAAGG